MDDKVMIGLDLSRRAQHQAVILRPGQPRPETRRLGSTAEEFEALVASAGGPERCVVVMEPTGMAWLPVSAWLIHRGCTVHRVDTRSAHGFRKIISRNVKSDRADAEALARMPTADPTRMRPLALATPSQFSLDRLVRMRADLVDQRARVYLQAVSTLEPFAPAMERLFGKSDRFTDARRYLMRHYCVPMDAAEAGVEGIRAALAAAEVDDLEDGELEAWVAAAQIDTALWRSMVECGRCPVDFQLLSFQVGVHLDRYEELTGHIEKLEDKISEVHRHTGLAKVIESLPGIGEVIGPAVLGAIGDVRRFPNAKAFACWLGLTPRKNQTGVSDRAGQRMSKAGNRLLRRYFYLAADSGRKSDLDLARWYFERTTRGMHHNAAITAIANRLAHRIYAVLKRAADGDTKGYTFHDEDGAELSKSESSRLVRERYPSKRARAAQAKKQVGRASNAQGKGQSKDSPRRSDEVSTQPESNPAPT